MISKRVALEWARKMEVPTAKVQVMRLEVALAYMELYGLEPAWTHGEVLVLRRTTPDPTPIPSPNILPMVGVFGEGNDVNSSGGE